MAAPVGHRQDRTLVRVESVQNIMAVLPDGFHHHQRRTRRQPAEYVHSVLLAIDESMLLDRVAGMPAAYVTAFAADGIHDGLFGLGLRRPAHSVGREPQIPTRNHNYSVRHVRIVTCAPPRSPGLDPGFLHSLAIHHAKMNRQVPHAAFSHGSLSRWGTSLACQPARSSDTPLTGAPAVRPGPPKPARPLLPRSGAPVSPRSC